MRSGRRDALTDTALVVTAQRGDRQALDALIGASCTDTDTAARTTGTTRTLPLDAADPGADFVDLTILRLELSDRRRETALATRRLDPDDRELLALWWLEAAGEMSRAELVAAIGLTPGHTSVRVQRMKQQLETARTIVRPLAAMPR